MTEITITCPNCSEEIELTESLAAPLVNETKQVYEKKLAENEIAKNKAIKEIQSSIEQEVSQKLENELKKIRIEEEEKAKKQAQIDLSKKEQELIELKDQISQKDEKLATAQKEQSNFLKKQRELDDAKRELDLTIEKRVQASINEVREKTKQEAENSLKLKITEKEETITSMQRQIEELRRKAEQGSQQLQGEAMELELEETLNNQFPFDIISPVPKGEFGGDILQKVTSSTGQICGEILWESKRTKNWSDGWIGKLKADQRQAKAEISILVSLAMPKEISTFGELDGVWVTAPQYAIPLVMALRQILIKVTNSKQVQVGQRTKMELVYEYLTGTNFRHRIEAIVEKFTDMKEDLDREKKAMTRLWAKREAQIQGVIETTVGMYGDLQGIAGKALQEIEGLEFKLIESEVDWLVIYLAHSEALENPQIILNKLGNIYYRVERKVKDQE